MQTGILKPGTRVILMDDLLATGGRYFLLLLNRN